MHFDEWGMKKYKATKRRNIAVLRHLSSPPTTSSGSASRSISTMVSSPPTSIDQSECRSESEPLPQIMDYQRQSQRMTDMLNKIDQAHNDVRHILQTIFNHWQPSREWTTILFGYFQNPTFDKWIPQHASDETPAVFRLVEYCVPESDRFALVKSLLEADLMTQDCPDHYASSWQESWYQACDATEWEEARDLLYEEGALSQTTGVFRDCALVVLAERLLEGYMMELDTWADRSLNDYEVEARDDVLKHYREILSNFHHAKEDVNPEFYRFVLRFCLSQNIDRGPRSNDDEYRLKFIHLSCSSNAKKLLYQISRRDLTSPRASPRPSRPSSSSLAFIMDPVIQVQRGLPPTPPVAADSPSRQLAALSPGIHSQSQTSLLALKQIRTWWRTLDCFTEYLSDLIRSSHINCDITIFAPRFTTFSKPENLFDLIYHNIAEESERITLTKAILLVASTTVPTIDDISQPTSPSTTTPLLLQWWANIYNISDNNLNYSVFQTQLLNNPKLDFDLNQVAHTSEGRNLFKDAAIALLSERYLGILKTGLSHKGSQKQRAGSRAECRQTYMNVMAVMKERGIRLDEGWMRALLDSM
jgi:hypothetical protein